MNIINKDNAILVVIDVQEKLVNMLNNNEVKENSIKIAKAASILDLPTIITEQYPKGLGATIEEIKELLPTAHYIEKTYFSAYKEDLFKSVIKESNKKQVIILGIESHICVLQTAIELVNDGFEVFVVEEACGSRNQKDKDIALKRLRHLNCKTVTVEMVIFELLEGSKNAKFKEVQAIIK